MIVVHHLNNSRSQRILWLLEELELPYEIKRYQRQTSMLAPPELKKVHPLGKAPVITDGDRVVAESGAILEYLVGRYDRNRLLTPLDEEEALEGRYWSHYAQRPLTPLVVMRLIWTASDAGRYSDDLPHSGAGGARRAGWHARYTGLAG